MTDGKKIRRTLHLRFTLSGPVEQFLPMIKSAAPFYQFFGEARVRLLQNVDDPTRFIQEIEYDAPRTLESSRQQTVGDPKFQAYLQGWRALFPGGVEIDIFQEI